MAAFGSRGGLLNNAPLKQGSCASKEGQANPALCQLGKAASGVRLETCFHPEAGDAAEKGFCGTDGSQ